MPIVIEIRSVGRPPEIREFLQGRLTLGRAVGNIALGDPQASAKHAEITVTSRGVTFVDLKSTNGSYLENGERIAGPFTWEPDVTILIGSSKLRLVSFNRPDFGPSGTLMVPAEPAKGRVVAVRETPVVEAAPPQARVQVPAPAPPPAAVPVAVAPAPAAQPSVPAKVSAVPEGREPSSLGLLAQCLRGYRGYVVSGWQVLGPWTLPLALISALGAVSELASIVALVISSLGYAVLFFFFGWGAHAEFAMRAYAGLPISSRQIWRLQTRRLIPWLVELLPSLLISFVGCAITLVAFGPMLTPVYMIERVNGLRINSRSVELLAMNWFLGLVPLGLVLTLAGLTLMVVSSALQLIPFVGNWLAALFGPMFAASVLPFIVFVQFSAYGATRKHSEGIDVAELIRKELE